MKKITFKAASLARGARDANVKLLKGYLQQFGYLNQDYLAKLGKDALTDLFDEATEASLKQYQGCHGLPVTGVFDEPTVDVMNQPRCGFPDLADFVLDGRRWDTHQLTYRIENTPATLTLTLPQVRVAVQQAFGLWAGVTPLSFSEAAPGQNAEIKIKFVAGEHGDGSSFDGAGHTLAHAFFPPPNGGDLAGDTHFDDAEVWDIAIVPANGAFDLVTVAAHEFGHALGLAHSNIQGTLMFPTYAGPRRFLSPDDIAGIRAIYGIA